MIKTKIPKALFLALSLSLSISAVAEKNSFLILGDIHYDLLENHDMEWLSKKPDDLRQVTKEFTQFTKNNWPTFSKILKERVEKYTPRIEAVVQLGDISEGLAGSEAKAAQMAQSVAEAVDEVGMRIPWIITKGNHDITGPGAVEAFDRYYIPMFSKQLGRSDITSANYAHQIGDNLFVSFDPWQKGVDVLDLLNSNLKSSDAKFKFVMVHEPVIPVNERCWHLYRKDPEKRTRLLEIIAKNNAIILTAHLHLFSIVKRQTEYYEEINPLLEDAIEDALVAEYNELKPIEKIIVSYSDCSDILYDETTSIGNRLMTCYHELLNQHYSNSKKIKDFELKKTW